MEGKKIVKQQSKDPFEAAFEDQDDSPPESPSAIADPPPPPASLTTSNPSSSFDAHDDDDPLPLPKHPSSSSAVPPTVSSRTHFPTSASGSASKHREDDEEEDEENVEVELEKFPTSSDPHKMAKMQAILSQFTEEQMSRYESFRRAGFQKSNMKRLLASITGTQKISVPMTIVVSGIAKMFVGEMVETARMVMAERKESGPIRPCHIREAYRRLKLEGKVPKRSVPRLFR
ncbi:hypothetical protein UlMin_004814 [Ulmus minor]